jgi:pimeloyl-ACP methyl ester carboxylesterase
MAHDHRTVVSKDGTKLWADAAGDPGKPAVIFIHGFSGSASHFERQFADANLLGGLYLVSISVVGKSLFV